MTAVGLGEIEAELVRQFGDDAGITPLTTSDRMGRRVDGVDLSRPLSAGQAQLMLSLFDRFQLITFPRQDRFGFDVHHLERVAAVHRGRTALAHGHRVRTSAAVDEHRLRPEFRYDHVHSPGDVTIWSNFAKLHVAPPVMQAIDDPADARLMYRVSCKGDPCLELPGRDAQGWIDDNIVPP